MPECSEAQSRALVGCCRRRRLAALFLPLSEREGSRLRRVQSISEHSTISENSLPYASQCALDGKEDFDG